VHTELVLDSLTQIAAQGTLASARCPVGLLARAETPVDRGGRLTARVHCPSGCPAGHSFVDVVHPAARRFGSDGRFDAARGATAPVSVSLPPRLARLLRRRGRVRVRLRASVDQPDGSTLGDTATTTLVLR
jgi:hypothetical protein